jgi:uncharacterized membrane protein YcgQ (UPF0703/DUF1980 family)
MLYLIGLPNKGRAVGDSTVALDLTQEAKAYAAVVGMWAAPLQQATLVAAALTEISEDQINEIGFMELKSSGYDPVQMNFWKDKTVQVKGQFSPDSRTDRFFNVVRFRIQCCGADATPVMIPVVCKEGVAGQPNEWVLVKGRVAYREVTPGRFEAFLVVPRRQNIERTDPDPRPYVQ